MYKRERFTRWEKYSRAFEIKLWRIYPRNRPWDSVYPIIFLDGVVFNVVEDGATRKKTAYIVYGINTEGYKEILGIWLGEAESSKFWMIVLSELRERGVKDILIASVLKFFVVIEIEFGSDFVSFIF